MTQLKLTKMKLDGETDRNNEIEEQLKQAKTELKQAKEVEKQRLN